MRGAPGMAVAREQATGICHAHKVRRRDARTLPAIDNLCRNPCPIANLAIERFLRNLR
jgi:hypothetical protein